MNDSKAFDDLQAFIERNPAARSVWAIDKMGGVWRVGIAVDGERLSAAQDKKLHKAIEGAITIATLAGYL